MYYIFCVHSSLDGQLCSFQPLAIIKKAAMNIVEHVFLLQLGASFWVYAQERYGWIKRKYAITIYLSLGSLT
jgi:hypothetical protein